VSPSRRAAATSARYSRKSRSRHPSVLCLLLGERKGLWSILREAWRPTLCRRKVGKGRGRTHKRARGRKYGGEQLAAMGKAGRTKRRPTSTATSKGPKSALWLRWAIWRRSRSQSLRPSMSRPKLEGAKLSPTPLPQRHKVPRGRSHCIGRKSLGVSLHRSSLQAGLCLAPALLQLQWIQAL